MWSQKLKISFIFPSSHSIEMEQKAYYFFSTYYKNGKKALIFGEPSINNNAFHKNGKSINNVKLEIKRIVLFS